MRRKDREITNPLALMRIIDCCKVFRIAFAVDLVPYIVPLNFGYRFANETFEFYFHSAQEGKKIELLHQNPIVCFELDCKHALHIEANPCAYSYQYQSVIGLGQASIVTSDAEKKWALQQIMKHQTNKEFLFTSEQVAAVAVGKITVSEICGKEHQ